MNAIDPLLEFPQIDADRMFNELGELRVELDDDPLVFGPKRLNAKTAQVRRMLDRCEKLFLDVSRKLQAVRRAMRVAETDFDLAKKNLFANDPETRAGRSVSDREAIAAGKLETEIRGIHDLNLSSEDLDAVLVVIKAKRADLKDTEGRLRDQIRLCSEEIGLGGRWGSKVPNAPEITGRAAFQTATGVDIDDVTSLIEGLEGEIALSRDSGAWRDPDDLSVPAPSPENPVVHTNAVGDITAWDVTTYCSDCDEPQFYTPSGLVCKNGHGGAPSKDKPGPTIVLKNDALVEDQANALANAIQETLQAETVPIVVLESDPGIVIPVEEIHLDHTPSLSKDLETTMGSQITEGEVELFLDEVTVSVALMPKPDMKKLVGDIDMDAILGLFETP